MAKRKVKQKEYVKVLGTPSMLMLPSRNYRFIVDTTEHVITIPRKGKYFDIAPDIFTIEDGEFDILAGAEENKGNITLYLPSLTKVLFGVSKYPDLKDNQAFVPIALVVNGDTIDIVGNVIDMLQGEK